MRILFIRPKAGFYATFSPQAPLAPLALASFIQAKGHAVRIFDHEVERSLMKAVAEFKPDAAAVTLLCMSMIPDATELSRALKEQGLPVFWGGPMASAIPEQIARSGCADYIGISEGEYTLLELLEVAEGRRAPETVLGIAYVDENGEYHRTADRPFADLADFPPLDYSLIPMERYLSRYLFTDRAMMMTTSKGCMFKCTFCFNSQFHRCQRREFPREVIFHQIKTLAQDHKIGGVLIVDELFGADKQDLQAFCQGMKDMNLGLTWGTETSIGILSREDLEMMHEAGCRMLNFGLESGSAEMRKKLQKYYDASKIDETFRNCREVGIMSSAGFIIGLPDETPEQAQETVRLYFRINADMVAVSFYTPIPGTQLYQAQVAAGQLQPQKTLEGYARKAMERQTLDQNYSHIPPKDLQVILNFVSWQTVFRKKRKIPGLKRDSFVKMGIINLRGYLHGVGLSGLIRGFWQSAKLFCTVAWYAHAYPAIRKKYDLTAKNFGRMDWD